MTFRRRRRGGGAVGAGEAWGAVGVCGGGGGSITTDPPLPRFSRAEHVKRFPKHRGIAGAPFFIYAYII